MMKDLANNNGIPFAFLDDCIKVQALARGRRVRHKIIYEAQKLFIEISNEISKTPGMELVPSDYLHIASVDERPSISAVLSLADIPQRSNRNRNNKPTSEDRSETKQADDSSNYSTQIFLGEDIDDKKHNCKCQATVEHPADKNQPLSAKTELYHMDGTEATKHSNSKPIFDQPQNATYLKPNDSTDLDSPAKRGMAFTPEEIKQNNAEATRDTNDVLQSPEKFNVTRATEIHGEHKLLQASTSFSVDEFKDYVLPEEFVNRTTEDIQVELNWAKNALKQRTQYLLQQQQEQVDRDLERNNV